MPEGPEIRLQIDSLKYLVNKTIVGINWSKSFQKNGVKNIEIVKLPLKISNLWSRGKVMVFETRDSEDKILYITSQLGMSGFWSETKYNHSNLWFKFGIPDSDNPGFWKVTNQIWYDDQRHFGGIGFWTDLSEVWKRHGPCLLTTALVKSELVNPEFLNPHQKLVSLEYYTNQIRNPRFKNKRIAEFIMDQSRVSGVGNYIRAEILYQAKISPTRLLTSLSDSDIKVLYECSLDIMLRSYVSKGAYQDQVNPDSDCGFGFEKLIYKKEKDPNGYDVVSFMDKNKRMCYYVPEIQK